MVIERRDFLRLAAALAVPAGARPPARAEAPKPNILFLAFDDLNQYVNCMGWRKGVHTPNMDRLASRGVLFTNAHCAAPVCRPSRTSLLTGVRPSTSGVYVNPGANQLSGWRRAPVLKDAVTLPQYFRKQGYRAAGAGKIFHALQWMKGSENDPESWDAYFPDMYDVIPKQITPKDFSVAKSNAEGRPNPWFVWEPLDEPDIAMSDYQVVDWAISELKKKHDKPFFQGVGIFRPHMPWHVPRKYFDLYPLETLELPHVQENDLADTHGHERRHWHKWVVDHHQWKQALQGYLASISFADAQLGRLLEAFDASPYARNTIVVMWSDNGMHMGEKENWEKFTLWEESTRVPLIFVAPGVTHRGTRCSHAVSLLDIYPTLVELTGGKPGPQLEGLSLVPQLRNPSAARGRPALTTHGRNNHAVRTDKWRYIRYDDGFEELYDHNADPYEFTNLARRDGYEAVKTELKRWLPEVNAPDIDQHP